MVEAMTRDHITYFGYQNIGSNYMLYFGEKMKRFFAARHILASPLLAMVKTASPGLGVLGCRAEAAGDSENMWTVWKELAFVVCAQHLLVALHSVPTPIQNSPRGTS